MRKVLAGLGLLLVVALLVARLGLKLGWFGPRSTDDLYRDLITAMNQTADYIDTLQTPADAAAKMRDVLNLNHRVTELIEKG
jgi:hypothetical protein